MTRHDTFRRTTGLLGISDTDRNPEFWSTDRLISMLDIGHPQRQSLLTLLASRDEPMARLYLNSLKDNNHAGIQHI